jgi:hypothetical protein
MLALIGSKSGLVIVSVGGSWAASKRSISIGSFMGSNAL